MRFKVAAYHCFHPILRTLRNSRIIIGRLFGVKIPPNVSVQFDPTTVLLARAVAESLTDNDKRALEVGIGQGALVGLSLMRAAKKQAISLSLDGIDCSTSRVESSQQVAGFNQIEARFWISDLFSEVSPEQQYDLIFFNPPYVPTGVGSELKLTKRLQVDGDQVWDGGEDGTSVLRMFLREAPRFLSSSGRVLFGVQDIFVPDQLVVDAVAETELRIVDRFKKRSIPSVVYILEHR